MDIPGQITGNIKTQCFTFSTTSKATPLMRMGSKSCWKFEKDIRISLHFSLFNWTLFSIVPVGALRPIRSMSNKAKVAEDFGTTPY